MSSRGQAPTIKSSRLSGEVDERALRLSVDLAFIRWRAASGREDFLDAAEELGVGDGPLALSAWILFGRTRADCDLDDASIRAVLVFCEHILSGEVAASSRDAI